MCNVPPVSVVRVRTSASCMVCHVNNYRRTEDVKTELFEVRIVTNPSTHCYTLCREHLGVLATQASHVLVKRPDPKRTLRAKAKARARRQRKEIDS